MLFNNAQACMSWLSYLQRERGGEALLGKDLTSVAQQVWLYNCEGDMLNFYGEIPLLGASAMDISCQYLVSLFNKGNAFRRHALEEQGELMTSFAQALVGLKGVAAESNCIFLEADTSQGEQEKLSVFYNLEGAYVEQLLPAILQGEKYPEMTDKVTALAAVLQGRASLWQVGCMQPREGRPLRLDFSLGREQLAEALALLKLPGREKLLQQVEALLETGCFRVDMLDLDMLPDGTVGPVVGLELATEQQVPARQLALYSTPAYEQFKLQLQRLGMADERINLLEQCVLSMEAPDQSQPPYYIYSGISHYKLQWQAGEAMPAKAYLRLCPVELQGSIND